MKMFILGEIAELAIVDTHGLIVEGDAFKVQGANKFAGRINNLGYPALGTGRIVEDRLIVNVMIDGAPFSLQHQSGDADHARWLLVSGHTGGLVQKSAA